MIYLKAVRLKTTPESSYLDNLPVVKFLYDTGQLEFQKPVTFFTGENGTGKSTLLEAVAVSMGLNPEGGSKDHFFSTKDSHSGLYRHLTPVRSAWPKDSFFLRAESFYNTATYLDENSTMQRYGGKSLHKQSHGESFLSLLLNRFEGRGFYLMDEPEAALSPQRQLSVLSILHDLVKKGSQFIIATHSPILMAYPDADILEFSEKGIYQIGYRDTEHYRVMKQFMDAPERMLKYLLEDSQGEDL